MTKSHKRQLITIAFIILIVGAFFLYALVYKDKPIGFVSGLSLFTCFARVGHLFEDIENN